MHDIEFVEESQILEALRELKLMKDEGIINNIGISGYPVDFLYKVAKQCVDDQDIGSLDVIMSYSNGCIQNEKLFGYYDRFIGECGLKKVLNGSILSMSLLRSGATHDFHPASKGLKDKMQEVAQGLKPVELADLATKFAYKRWLFDTNKANELGSAPSLQPNSKCSIVLGVSNVEELEAAIKNYTEVKERIYENENEKLFSKVQKELGEHLNETWRSGIHRDLD